ncbi:MAG: zinc metalloprotease HtpX [Candidatus Aenigmarchaeota archaeon]|nr:zinc metalloprotease HtpX [Candidatus Aenigmarchaeota archaeon]
MIFRTALLFGVLTAIFLSIGLFFGGTGGMFIALIFSIVVNFFSYWFSDKIVLMMYRAKPVKNKDAPDLHSMLKELSVKAGIPKPGLYLVEMDIPNAFATGRSPKHSAVVVTRGLLAALNTDEIKGVIAHEITHIKHRDTLLSTMAASVAGALTWLGYLFFFSDERNRNFFSYLILFIAAPLAAMLVRLAISRNREFFADRGGAEISDPLELASALEKISSSGKSLNTKPSTAHMFIVNPFSAGNVASLFSTHPPINERVARLRNMAMR